jgi:hypothetical protein
MAVMTKDIVSFDVTDEMISEAISIRKERDSKYGNIFVEEETDMRFVGEIGEIIVNNAFNMVCEEFNEWHTEDVIKKPDFTFCGRDLDVKTVKRQVPIKPWFKAQITAKHSETPMDDILFTCYEVPKKKLHILGVMEKNEFLQKAQYFGEGEFVHENYQIRKGHEIYAVMISQMTPFRDYLIEQKRKYTTMKSVA